jgi:hypothetical protein
VVGIQTRLPEMRSTENTQGIAEGPPQSFFSTHTGDVGLNQAFSAKE